MNWIIDILLICLFGLFLAVWVCGHWEKKAIKDRYVIVGHKLYKVTEVKNERQI